MYPIANELIKILLTSKSKPLTNIFVNWLIVFHIPIDNNSFTALHLKHLNDIFNSGANLWRYFQFIRIQYILAMPDDNPMNHTLGAKKQNELNKIKCPTLIIWGTNDEAVSIEDAYELEKIIKDSAVIEYEGCTHYAYLERLNQTVNVLRSFIGGND